MPLLLSLSALVGLTIGLLGGGGSILLTPVLLYVADVPAKEAIATSLVVIAATAGFAAIQHARQGNVQWGKGLRFAAASMAGAYLGGRLAGLLDAQVLLAVFTAVMAVAGALMLRKAGPEPTGTHREHLPKLIATASLTGTVAGLVGAGGGFLVVPLLTFVCGLPVREAIGTSLVVIALQSFAGVAGHLGHVDVDARLVALVTGAAFAGSLAGMALSKRLKPAHLRRGFGVLVLGMAAFMVYRLTLGGS